MKTNILKYLLTVVIAVMLFACEDLIEVDRPESQLAGQAVFETPATAKAALADIYARLRDGGFASGTTTSATLLLGSYADEFTFYGANIEIRQFDNHTVLASNSLLTSLWDLSYSQIYACNALISGVESSQFITGEDRDRLIGEALFIRAYLHFFLTNTFGDVPYMIFTDYAQNAVVAKTPRQQVYILINEDLNRAASLLPETYPTAERVRANKAVVSALQARIYLYAEDWINAENKATEIIESPSYLMELNPELVFLKDSPSIILALHSGIAGRNTHDAETLALYDGPPSKSALSESFYNSFEINDNRKNFWIKTITDGTDSWYQAYKYKRETDTPAASEEYTILFRLEEQYLIRAEARARLGNVSGAQEDLNKIRNRAGLSDTTADNSESLNHAILEERRFELFTEQGHRWFDLKRTGMAQEILAPIKPNYRSTDLLLPIPANELLLNNNLQPQNPGY